MNLLSIIKIARPHQWVKNLFVALPMFFNGSLLDLQCWRQTAISFVAFSFMASAIYCLNDIRDVEADKLHPKKKRRPIASGKVSVFQAYSLMAILIAASLACCLLAGAAATRLMAIVAFYFVLNVAYCLKLKMYAIVDVFIVSFGFVLRLMAGGAACGIWLSPWIVLMTFLIALFLSFAKRRDDVALREETGVVLRKNTLNYNLEFLNQTLGVIGSITIVCYIIYAVSPEVETRMGSNYVYITSVFVLAGILRYLQLAIVYAQSGSPTRVLLRDRFIQCSVALWLLSFFMIIYL
ncbi:MAG: decaprenyl-phosphate phosphoribosyltransferase [Clostridium sp.]|nr:decaprenyl-phosphate phosphoribosyltransferase [Clostridium sp.]